MERLVPVEQLPLVDEHSVVIAAGVDDVWRALVRLDKAFAGRGTAAYARAVGCDPAAVAGPRPLAEGSSWPGFRVVNAVPPSELVLAGRHRFSSYALTFRIHELERGRSLIRAETRAKFPGTAGTIYRLLVIGTRGHVFAMRRLLSGIKRAAESPREPETLSPS